VLKYKFTYFAFLFSVLIIFFSVIPLQIRVVESYNFFSLDKLLHFLIYLAYTCSIYLSLLKEISVKNPKLKSMFIAFFIGFSLELIQGFFLIHRSFEILDLFSNCAGILTFVLVTKTIKKVIA
tara:strand:+ start:468 stop:836 length:369 start_codon:yes stop_codon:yes gene_type:complete